MLIFPEECLLRNKKLYRITLVVLVLAAMMLQPVQALLPLPGSFNGEVHYQAADSTPVEGDYREVWGLAMAS